MKALLPEWADDEDVHRYSSIKFETTMSGECASMQLGWKKMVTLRAGMLCPQWKQKNVVIICYRYNDAVP